MKSLLPLPENPNFGSRISRRRVRLVSEAGRVVAEFADIYHQMHCELYHDGEKILSVKASMPRIPTSLCRGAIDVLDALKGTSLTTSLSDLYGGNRSREHCTHLFDLAVLALRHSQRPGELIYDAEVPDMNQTVEISVTRNGKLVHNWRIRDEKIVLPVDLSGKPILKGFMAWASKHYDEDELEAALVLSRTVFIARGRRFAIDRGRGHTLDVHKSLEGSCFAYQPSRSPFGHYLGTNERDFTASAEIQPIKML